MGIWLPDLKTLYYVNAGHNPPILIDKHNKIRSLEATGLILGVLPGQQYEVKTEKIDEGSLLLIYSDGLEEAMNPRSEIFGRERIISSLAESRDHSPHAIIKHLHKRAAEFCEGKAFHDDLTMIVAKG
jgi:sigma-B regulation protein RsbU (phosphoserine phosphatase)